MNSRKQPTIRDIAKLAGVSYQTVSLVINDKPGVSEKTRREIVRLMGELGYRPNRAAQMLMTNRSHTLELIVVDVNYGGRLADSTKNMAHAAKEAGYSLLVSESTSQGLDAALESAAARLVDGVILYAPRLHMDDDELQRICRGIPVVRRDYVPSSRLAWVGFDQVHAARLATEHLLSLGHRQIAAVPPTSALHNGYWRHATIRSVLHEHDLKLVAVAEGDYSMRSGYEGVKQILASRQPFTGLIVGTDSMAQGALRALHEAGLHIPQEVSVVSFDNAELSLYTEPPLTTVEFRFIKQDELSIKYLLELIAEPQMELHHRILVPALLVRESTHEVAS
ncbi:MAG: LacI family transcriptional regulator [Anaerolineae bacterium]|nr:LacI family transcriptional regulator [Anaerolineae bacterium]NUQ03042.1 LacI family DNA-binding transcriptional regulator [Anaerolineae bacterium]